VLRSGLPGRRARMNPPNIFGPKFSSHPTRPLFAARRLGADSAAQGEPNPCPESSARLASSRKEGSRMDPARLPHAPHPVAPDSETAFGDPIDELAVMSAGMLTTLAKALGVPVTKLLA
jgi:hypothetical protein